MKPKKKVLSVTQTRNGIARVTSSGQPAEMEKCSRPSQSAVVGRVILTMKLAHPEAFTAKMEKKRHVSHSAYRRLAVLNRQHEHVCFKSAHLDTARRSALPKNVATNVREQCTKRQSFYTSDSICSERSCISIHNLLKLLGSRASFLRNDGG